MHAKSSTIGTLMDGDFSVAALTEPLLVSQIVDQLVAEESLLPSTDD